jgi:hypothetical protein
MSSETQIQANRENALLSTGPKTGDGKATSSLNAVKTGLTGRTVLLPSDDVAAYESHVAGFFTQYQPEGDPEHRLVQSLADTEWRLLRIPSLESGIYALGRLELAAEFASEPDHTVRAALIEAKSSALAAATSATSASRKAVCAGNGKKIGPSSTPSRPRAKRSTLKP